MNENYIFEGNTTNDAIEKGLRELKVSKNEVEIKVLEENKRSFFSILEPRIVKVQITPKIKNNNLVVEKKEITISADEIEEAKVIVENFIKEFINKLNINDVNYSIKYEDNIIKIQFEGDKLKNLIGYRGDTLNSFEHIINSILKNNKNHLRVSCNINNFREQRTIALNELADNMSKTVLRTGKRIVLDPMPAYERKIIHTRLQEHEKVRTYSIGEGARRKLVIDLK